MTGQPCPGTVDVRTGQQHAVMGREHAADQQVPQLCEPFDRLEPFGLGQLERDGERV